MKNAKIFYKNKNLERAMAILLTNHTEGNTLRLTTPAIEHQVIK